MSLEDLDRMTASFAASLREQQRQVETGMRSVAAELERAADRVAAAMGSGPGAGAPAPVAAPAPAAALAGPLSVRVLDTPLPVRVVNFPPQPGGTATTVAAAAGAGVGNLIGGIVSGFMSPFTAVVDLALMVVIADRIQTIVRDLRAFWTTFITSLQATISLLFSELTAAGIFPVARLFASLLFLIDRGITLVLAHVHPIIVWAERLVETVAAWVGRTLSAAIAWLGNVVNALASFLPAYLDYLKDAFLRPLVHQLIVDMGNMVVGGIMSGAYLLAALMEAAFDYGYAVLARWLIQLGNVLRLPGTAPTPVPPEPRVPDWDAVATAGMRRGRAAGIALVEALAGPEPARPTGPPPRFRMPGFRAPELHLPDMPGPAPQLERVLATPPSREPLPRPAQQTTVNGGVTVQVRAETVSMDNAEATARVLATHLVDEIARLTQADRFARGLPTGAAA